MFPFVAIYNLRQYVLQHGSNSFSAFRFCSTVALE